MTDPRARVRPVRPDDLPAVHALVRELAAYEDEPDAVEATVEDLAAALLAEQARVHCLVAEVDGVVVGTALWFVSFSTWRGRHGIWLEDLVVAAGSRGRGVGRALLAALAAECDRRGWARLEWAVLDRNAPAHGFYRALGAAPQEDWTTWRLDGDGLAGLAASTGSEGTDRTDGTDRPRVP